MTANSNAEVTANRNAEVTANRNAALREQGRTRSPWLHGAVMAAAYAGIGERDMRRLIAKDKVISRHKPPREDGTVPAGLLIYAPSIDQLILEQPSGANPVALALEEVS